MSKDKIMKLIELYVEFISSIFLWCSAFVLSPTPNNYNKNLFALFIYAANYK